MSEVVVVRKALEDLRKEAGTLGYCRVYPRELDVWIELLKRERPEFKAPVKYHKLMGEQRVLARSMRRDGAGVNDIARALHTNSGRVSEVINGKRK